MSPTPPESGWRRRRWIAAGWAIATLAALTVLQGAPGISRDEAAVVASAGRGLGARREASPPLAPAVAGIAHAAGISAGLSHVRAYRLGSALAGALLSALLSAAAFALSGPAAAMLAPALFWLAPRTLHAGLVATPDVALAALALAAVLAFRRTWTAEPPSRRTWAAVIAGLLLGAAVLARADAWTLAVALAVGAAVAHVLARRSEAPSGAGSAAAKVVLAAGAGAALVAVGWPGVFRAGAGPWLPPAGGAAAPVLALAAIPVPLLWVFAGGLAHAAVRIFGSLRFRAAAPAASLDVLLVLAALTALGGSALAHAPAGARPFLHALPLLALLGARAMVRAAELAWPARRVAVLAGIALLVLYPGLRSTARSFPDGAAAWNELVGGAAGAASRGLRRQDGGEAAAALLPALNERAAEGARLWWPDVAPQAVALYARDGLLRRDLAIAAGPDDADVAIVTLDGGSRDAEYRAWAALRTARPSRGVYADEVPLAFAYARPGAWR